jgi:hypothetical protein
VSHFQCAPLLGWAVLTKVAREPFRRLARNQLNAWGSKMTLEQSVFNGFGQFISVFTRCSTCHQMPIVRADWAEKRSSTRGHVRYPPSFKILCWRGLGQEIGPARNLLVLEQNLTIFPASAGISRITVSSRIFKLFRGALACWWGATLGSLFGGPSRSPGAPTSRNPTTLVGLRESHRLRCARQS